MPWVKPLPGQREPECYSCGSSLLRTDGTRINCFICGAGDFVFTPSEAFGVDVEVLRELAGREPGANYEIIPRVHTVWEQVSSIVTAMSMMEEFANYYVRKI